MAAYVLTAAAVRVVFNLIAVRAGRMIREDIILAYTLLACWGRADEMSMEARERSVVLRLGHHSLVTGNEVERSELYNVT